MVHTGRRKTAVTIDAAIAALSLREISSAVADSKLYIELQRHDICI